MDLPDGIDVDHLSAVDLEKHLFVKAFHQPFYRIGVQVPLAIERMEEGESVVGVHTGDVRAVDKLEMAALFHQAAQLLLFRLPCEQLFQLSRQTGRAVPLVFVECRPQIVFVDGLEQVADAVQPERLDRILRIYMRKKYFANCTILPYL